MFVVSCFLVRLTMSQDYPVPRAVPMWLMASQVQAITTEPKSFETARHIPSTRRRDPTSNDVMNTEPRVYTFFPCIYELQLQ